MILKIFYCLCDEIVIKSCQVNQIKSIPKMAKATNNPYPMWEFQSVWTALPILQFEPAVLETLI